MSALCRCGCGELAPIAKVTRRARNQRAGEPVKYIKGHRHRANTPAFRVEDRGHGTPCWMWARSVHAHGYGYTYDRRRHKLAIAHRVFWERLHGGVPEGLQLDHLCRNRACVNPDHLELVTPGENCRRGATAKLTWDDVREIRSRQGSTRSIGAEFGIGSSQVSRILRGLSWVPILALVVAWPQSATDAQAHRRLDCRTQPEVCASALAWQKHERARLTRELRRTRRHLRRVHTPTIREAAFLAGRALGVDPWALLRVGACESHLDPYAVNPSSGAAGVLQFLSSTWAHTPFAAFPRTNPYAEMLAAAQIARTEGFSQWTCRP